MLKKNLLILVTSILFLVFASGCSLFKSDTSEDGAEEAVVAEDVAFAEEPLTETTDLGDDIDFGSEGGMEIATEDFGDGADVAIYEEEVVDEYPDDDYGMAATDLGGTGEGLPEDTLETNQEETLFIGAEDGGTSQTLSDAGFQEMEEPMMAEPESDFMAAAPESDFMTDDSYASEPEPITPVQDYYEPESVSVGYVPVKKMKHTPYTRAGSNINRLYIVREGDTMSSIADKIYGDSNRSSDLFAWNSHFQGKSINVGDKIYYSSPRNPNDTSQILTYYEDMGIPAQYYSASAGEGTHKLAKKLLGHPRSWMEIWATNEELEQQEKWTIADNTQIRYWPSGAQAAPAMNMAQNTAPAQPEPETTFEEPEPIQETPPPAPEPTPIADVPDPAPLEEGGMEAGMPEEQEALAAAESIPPPSEDIPPPDEFSEEPDGSAGQVAAMDEPPPPPPSEPVAPPPPPPPQPVAPPEPPSGVEGIASMLNGKDDSMLTLVLGVCLVGAALILLIFIRRGRKKVKYS